MWIVELLYGADYHRLLAEELIGIKKHKRLLWGVALAMNFIVSIATLMLWPLD